MSISNMAIEAGARAGIIAPDDVTFEYLKGRPMSPKGEAWDKAVAYWKTLASDADSEYDTEIVIKGSDIEPTVTWGTSPQDVRHQRRRSRPGGFRREPREGDAPLSGVHGPGAGDQDGGRQDRQVLHRLLHERPHRGHPRRRRVAKGKKVADHVYAMVVPGSGVVKDQAEAEGLDKILVEAGFDWREPGCSMCLAMNPDKLLPQGALRVHLQPQLRGEAGQRRQDAPRLPGDGRGGGDHREPRGRS